MAVLSALGLKRRPTFEERVLTFLVHWAVLSVAVWVAASLVSGITWEGWGSIIAVALILGLLNALVRPILFLVSLPLTVLTLGLFLVVINAFLLWLAGRIGDHFSQVHFAIAHFFWDAILGAIIITIVNWALNVLLKTVKLPTG